MQIVVTGVTVGVVVALGLLLKWSVDTGNWWWAFPAVILTTVYGYFRLTDAAERQRGMKEVSDSMKRLFRVKWLRR